jgi:hypothetical protein
MTKWEYAQVRTTEFVNKGYVYKITRQVHYSLREQEECETEDLISIAGRLGENGWEMVGDAMWFKRPR